MAIAKNTSSLDLINQVAMKTMIPKIHEQIFNSNPIMHYLQGRNFWKMRAYDVYRMAGRNGYANPYKVKYPGGMSW